MSIMLTRVDVTQAQYIERVRYLIRCPYRQVSGGTSTFHTHFVQFSFLMYLKYKMNNFECPFFCLWNCHSRIITFLCNFSTDIEIWVLFHCLFFIRCFVKLIDLKYLRWDFFYFKPFFFCNKISAWNKFNCFVSR